MTLRRADMRAVTVKARLKPEVYSADERPAFEPEGSTVEAVIQPLSVIRYAEAYGERVSDMLLMLTRSRMHFAAGMGVCVGESGGACDYRIAEPPRKCRGHTRIVLERL